MPHARAKPNVAGSLSYMNPYYEGPQGEPISGRGRKTLQSDEGQGDPPYYLTWEEDVNVEKLTRFYKPQNVFF